MEGAFCLDLYFSSGSEDLFYDHELGLGFSPVIDQTDFTMKNELRLREILFHFKEVNNLFFF